MILLFVFLNLNYNSVCKAQKNQITPEVDYIRYTQIIDGFLDESLKFLPVRELPMKIDLFLFKSFKESNYRIAYTVDFLYLYMEGKADSITCKERVNIFLSGFSMGGYGVYRTFYENPKRYKAIAIIAGEPKINIFMKQKGGKYPNFLKQKYTRYFKDIPIFIYHGANDLNCPYPLTRKMIIKLERNGADIIRDIYTGSGHSVPYGPEFTSKFDEWIKTCHSPLDQ